MFSQVVQEVLSAKITILFKVFKEFNDTRLHEGYYTSNNLFFLPHS